MNILNNTMGDINLEKFKMAVISHYVAGLLMLGVTYAPIFIPFGDIEPNLLIFYIALAVLVVFCFVKQATFYKGKMPFYNSRRRYIWEIILFAFCFLYAMIIGFFPMWFLEISLNTFFLIAKILLLIIVLFSTVLVLQSARRIAQICVKELKSDGQL